MTVGAGPPVPIAPSVPHRYTAGDLLRLADSGVAEVVYGRLVEKDRSADANWTAGRLAHYLSTHLMQTDAGDMFPEQSFRCVPDDPDGFRRPDVAFVAAGRVPSPAPRGPLRLVPDLTVEVVSPADNVEELESKLADYRSAEIPLVWVVIPAVQLVRVFPRGRPNLELVAGDTLTGGDVLPGFAVPVADLFRPSAVPLPPPLTPPPPAGGRSSEPLD